MEPRQEGNACVKVKGPSGSKRKDPEGPEMPAPEEINAGEKETRRQGNFFQRFGKRKIEKAKKEKSKEKRAHLLEKRGGKGPERLARRDRRPNGTRVFMMNLRQGGHPAPGDSNESKNRRGDPVLP
jgi:hypothetical protein